MNKKRKRTTVKALSNSKDRNLSVQKSINTVVMIYLKVNQGTLKWKNVAKHQAPIYKRLVKDVYQYLVHTLACY